MVRQLLIASIIVGMHVSLCTGGVASLLTATIDTLVSPMQQDGPMSYGAIGYLRCEEAKHTNVSHTQASSGCGSTEKCLSDSSGTTRKTPLVLHYVEEIQPVAIEDAAQIDTTIAVSMVLARAGPLYEHATMLSHSLIKRE